ncbi:MAG: NnrU family protein [Kiloniellaceae bacterium]
MTTFLLAIAVFIVAHVVPAATGLRAWLIGRFGRRAYLVGYSLVSLAALAWVIPPRCCISTGRSSPSIPLPGFEGAWFACSLNPHRCRTRARSA